MTFLRANSVGGEPGPGAEAPQVAALCYRRARGGTEVLLITSRDTGRWIIPKGWPVDGLSAGDSALREAYEEAGVRGRITGAALGDYCYLKRLGADRTVPCKVVVFPVLVEHLVKAFPEKDQRALKWFKPAKASQKVEEAELQAILAGFTAPE